MPPDDPTHRGGGWASWESGVDELALARRDEILADHRTAVAELVERVRQWLRPYEGKGLLRLESAAREVDEYRLGTYTIDQLVVRAGADAVELRPGTIVKRGRGRG